MIPVLACTRHPLPMPTTVHGLRGQFYVRHRAPSRAFLTSLIVRLRINPMLKYARHGEGVLPREHRRPSTTKGTAMKSVATTKGAAMKIIAKRPVVRLVNSCRTTA